MRIQHYLTVDMSAQYDKQSNAEFWGGFFYDMTVGIWWFWVLVLTVGLTVGLGFTHDERKRKRRIRDLVRQGNFYEASIVSAQNERATYETNIGIAAGLALGAMGDKDKEHRNTMLMLTGAGALYNTRQLDHFDSIDFEDHRRGHEALLRKKYKKYSPPPQERPAHLSPTVTVVRECANSECRRRLRSTSRRASRSLIRCPECGREQWRTYP